MDDNLQFGNILHSWNLSIEEAIRVQQILNDMLYLELPPNVHLDKISYIAGVDSTYSYDGKTIITAVVLWNVKKKKIEEISIESDSVVFPYIPGLLSFREAPTSIKAIAKLKIKPEIVIIDGQGIAHPRGLGLASHVGLWVKLPTIGVAKRLLCGEIKFANEKEKPKKLLEAEIVYNGKVVGVALVTKPNTLPIYISPGNLIDLRSAVSVVKLCLNGFKIPEPTRLAHNYLQDYKRHHKI